MVSSCDSNHMRDLIVGFGPDKNGWNVACFPKSGVGPVRPQGVKTVLRRNLGVTEDAFACKEAFKLLSKSLSVTQLWTPSAL